MNIVSNIDEWKKLRASLVDKSVGLVMTMGALHEGHLSLCQRAKAENDITVVSIFVNPTQFNNAQDFEKYPRDFQRDLALLENHQIDFVFMPDAAEIYADHYQFKVSESEVSACLEGEFRPGHFDGMLTIVLKMFNLTRPTRAYFGEKDYQQLSLVKKMAQALFLPLEVVGCSTVRATNRLALSSRNARLSEAEKEKAAQFAQLLQAKSSPAEIAAQLEAMGFKVEYVVEQWQRRLAAVWLGDVRLIDNIALEEIC